MDESVEREFDSVRILAGTPSSDLYLVDGSRFGRDLVVVKVLRATVGADERDLFTDGNAVASRYRHPNLIEVLSEGQLSDGRLWVAMPFFARGSLAEVGEQPIETMLHVGARVADLLDLLHGRGVLHRDVKPANILIDDFGEPVLADLHVAGRLHEETTSITTGLATRSYAAPEIVETGRYTVRSEVYSLGLTLAALATDTPSPAEELIGRMIAADPELRPRSCGEVAETLRDLQRALDLPVTVETPPLETSEPSPRRPPRRTFRRVIFRRGRRRASVAAVVAVTLLGGAAVGGAALTGWFSSGSPVASERAPSETDQPYLRDDFDGNRLDPSKWLPPMQPEHIAPGDRVLNLIGTTNSAETVDTDLVPRSQNEFRELDFQVGVSSADYPGPGGGSVIVTEQGGRTHRFIYGPSPGEPTAVMGALICTRPTCSTYDDYVPPPPTRPFERLAPADRVAVSIVHVGSELTFSVRGTVMARAVVTEPLVSFRINAYATPGERWRLLLDGIRVYR
ncbi:serine/threonine-protein kinase [Actinomycetospora sp. TBRC 11914]|uniref:serine/threonine-protein kinase n=1 Tax=Actinomycetospora sp. TBRC 11914 TaxID=2729387 RepID=UPI00145E238B|nr:serine/threonine-protein kinase [Actinomycetospora sp. TBRC 11914]NMO90344.1 serine/threonine protein kinase [Actinomycetospora sp. TBRC 11914]